MLPFDFVPLAQQCAPQVSLLTMAAIVRTESGFNPYAIGVVHGRLVRQPTSEAEAVATVHALDAGGWNFSVGLAQVNRANWPTYGLNEQNAFDPCRNLAVGAAILQGCFELARQARAHASNDSQSALRASLSCYASGDFSTGYRTGYVRRVVSNASVLAPSSEPVVVPPIAPIPVVPVGSDASDPPGRSRPERHPVSEPADPSTGNSTRDPNDSAVVF
ncbi:transglycosylase SLT domain protein [Paraburkholderia xenovorans LB400]|jgi:type IV secretion system protein VirB1|uniref:Conjugal transfer protein, VirB1/TraA like protein n=1 Tax=Paraburkholderia xenovorans (strain LB400) TaxID=266265 RepID=Q140D8_PARXL|nr:lytic transglycosylase domain-containing protein [Paraburkholderia xenovorans]ABE30301.1 Putative conjugal transfer protein, VirB1/TraA like protein [Paraburkholderia xenovorans LB400]AIP33324.1 transglycosylase SLT domain protein [Paraburkholderia xenovorans LB400]